MKLDVLKNVAIAATLAAPVALLGAQEAKASHLDFIFHNQSWLPVIELYVSPSTSTSWGYDILGRSVLPPLSSLDVFVPPTSGTCYYDVKAVFPFGEMIEEQVNLCSVTDVSFY